MMGPWWRIVFFVTTVQAWTVPLPAEFTVQVLTHAPSPSGVELVWTSSVGLVAHMGGARPEFRVVDSSTGTVRLLGYPREVQGNLHLLVTPANQNDLATLGATLQVWSSSRRLDTTGGHNPLLAASSDRGNVRGDVDKMSSTPTTTVNPARKGRWTTSRLSYRLDALNVSYAEPIEVVGEVTVPSTTESMPLVVVLHGRHSTCYRGSASTGTVEITWPCPRGYKPIPSHWGYRYVADILASQGYLVVSISANGINGQDGFSADAGASARSLLIRHHLNVWAEWHTVGGDPWNNQFLDRVDLDHVVLVGHSRGGEGVHRAAVDATVDDPYTIVGLVSYGPTAFAQVVTPDVASVTILPTCDGDVSDLQGQNYVDLTRDLVTESSSQALRSAVISLGTNHNYFNTEWTPGLSQAPSNDDWFDTEDPVCGTRTGRLRLTPAEQQTVGAVYTAALVRLAVRQDAAMLPLLDGSYVRPVAIGRADVAVNAVGGARYRVVYRPEFNGTLAPRTRNGMKAHECTATFDPNSFVDVPFDDDLFEQTISPSRPVPTTRPPLTATTPEVLYCGGTLLSFIAPHWQPLTTRPIAHALELTWQNKGAAARFPVKPSHANLSGHDWIDLRIINDPERTGAAFQIVVVDQRGRNATLPSNLTTIKSWPGRGGLDRYHARTLRGRLSPSSRVDLTRIVTIALVAQGASGKVWVLDVAASQARVVRQAPLHLPRVSVESRSVLETDGLERYNIRIVADAPLKTPGKIWVEPVSLSFFGPEPSSRGYFLELTPGDTVLAEIPVESIGDNVYSNTSSFGGFPSPSTNAYRIEAVTGVVTGESIGSLTITEDEPAPTVTITPRTAVAVESKSLVWTLTLSSETAGTTLYFTATSPVAAEELTSHDVPASWLTAMGSSRPSLPVPLSELLLVIPVRFDYGITTTTLRIPVIPDGQAEGNKLIVLQTLSGFTTFDVGRLTMIGQVKAHS